MIRFILLLIVCLFFAAPAYAESAKPVTKTSTSAAKKRASKKNRVVRSACPDTLPVPDLVVKNGDEGEIIWKCLKGKKGYYWHVEVIKKNKDAPSALVAPEPQQPPVATTTEMLPPEEGELIRGKWSVGIGFGTTGVVISGGPTAYSANGAATIDLMIKPEELYGRFQAGLGPAWIEGVTLLGTTAFIGLNWVPREPWSLSAGGRHNLFFKAEGDVLNALLLELQVARPVWNDFHLSAALGLGYGHHQVPTKDVYMSTIFEDYRSPMKYTWDVAYGIGLSAYHQF